MRDRLVINEIYRSLQGESSFAGLPCIFVRLTACDLRCSYCDTAYAFSAGKSMSMGEVLARVGELAQPRFRSPAGFDLPLVELTGGEPLLQPASTGLMSALVEEGYTVLLETSGAHDIGRVDSRVHRIMDLKCPSSGEVSRNRWENLDHLTSRDEIKFVIGTQEDYEWAKQQLARYDLARKCTVLCSWVSPLGPAQMDKSLKTIPPGQTLLTRQQLAERILADALPVRFQLQMHKIVWSPEARGV